MDDILMSKLANKPNFDDLQDKVIENQICNKQMQKALNELILEIKMSEINLIKIQLGN
jgi:hypothetical protein